MTPKISPVTEPSWVRALLLLTALIFVGVLVLFGLDPAQEPCRAKIVHESHLARARWMTETGYQHLLEPRVQ